MTPKGRRRRRVKPIVVDGRRHQRWSHRQPRAERVRKPVLVIAGRYVEI